MGSMQNQQFLLPSYPKYQFLSRKHNWQRVCGPTALSPASWSFIYSSWVCIESDCGKVRLTVNRGGKNDFHCQKREPDALHSRCEVKWLWTQKNSTWFVFAINQSPTGPPLAWWGLDIHVQGCFDDPFVESTCPKERKSVSDDWGRWSETDICRSPSANVQSLFLNSISISRGTIHLRDGCVSEEAQTIPLLSYLLQLLENTQEIQDWWEM